MSDIDRGRRYLCKPGKQSRFFVNLLIHDTRAPGQKSLILAHEGQLVIDQEAKRVRLELREGSRHTFSVADPTEYRRTAFRTMGFDLPFDELFPKRPLQKGHREMTLRELSSRIEELRTQGRPASEWGRYAVEWHKRFAIPFACIVFGLLGLAVFINFFGLPRSAPLVGGLVLSLMTLPTIIIASRASLQSVPPSIREAALGVGASKMQMVAHHVLPLALPGMLTGTIIGMARALGESAPLLMIGMVAFIVDIPGGFTDPATVLPVQIYLWADSPERAFVELTSAATMVLLAFLIVMNAAAVILRRRFERRW